jgi:CheY-like chemotaxis protein
MSYRNVRVLAVDDEPQVMERWWSRLEEARLRVVRCRDTRRAVVLYNYDYYDLIILDRMMTLCKELGGDDVNQVPLAAATLYGDIRKRPHLKRVPIIIFTNYFDPVEAQALESRDERVLVRRKSLNPTAFVKVACDLVDRFPVPVNREAPLVPTVDHANLAPYFIKTISSEGGGWRWNDCRVFFEQCRHIDGEVSGLLGQSGWVFSGVFKQLIEDPSQCHRVLKLIRLDTDEVVGLHYDDGSSTGTGARSILCETVPWFRHDSTGRMARGIGLALIARCFRECLQNWDVGEQEFMSGHRGMPEAFEINDQRNETSKFLKSLGFISVEGFAGRWRIDRTSAIRILNEVSRRVG